MNGEHLLFPRCSECKEKMRKAYIRRSNAGGDRFIPVGWACEACKRLVWKNKGD